LTHPWPDSLKRGKNSNIIKNEKGEITTDTAVIKKKHTKIL